MKKNKSVLLLLIGAIIGYSFSYYMLSYSVSYNIEQAYELGYNFGVYTAYNNLLDTLQSTNVNIESNPYFSTKQK